MRGDGLWQEGEAAKLAEELLVALKTREEEHSARVRAQLQGTVRRLMQQAHDAKPAPPKQTLASVAESLAPSAAVDSTRRKSEPLEPGRRKSVVTRRAVSSDELRRPSVAVRRLSAASAFTRGAPAGDEADSDVPLLSLAAQLSKVQQPLKKTPRSMGTAAQATRCAELLRSLHAQHVDDVDADEEDGAQSF